ncbi:acyltransferase family protein [Agrobacterium radiobacter]|uniref:acyltransferase family protein n=1 Tax=Agrobacterium radiobacter TaxID=362 RepID=UPI001606C06A|nr:acyltransferase family protein [Agrobacterium radiobacter]MBB4407517.1 fucose 4-O-acetylase-like acetyltransferase [Agrobacterium radiobacter]MBB4452280.1 fucose 4-O-acetylase-like acetyltransferase [Agrobacterium radiobacter]
MKPKNPRDYSYDVAKGLCIILVVFGHAERGLNGSVAPPHFSLMGFADYAIYTFHMPFFFFVSGLFFSGQDTTPKDFSAKIAKNIAYPYILWSMLHGSLMVVMGRLGLTNTTIDFTRVLEILWSPISPFWFLYSLFFCQLASHVFVWVPALVRVAFALILFIFFYLQGQQVPWDIAYGFIYFTLGVFAKQYGFQQKRYTMPLFLALLTAFAISTYFSWQIEIPERFPFLSAALGIVVIVAISQALVIRESPISSILNALGQLSVGIYVMHIIAIGFGRAVAVKLLHVTDIASLLAITTIIGVALPAIVQMAAIRFGIHEWVALPASAYRRHNASAA